MSSSIMHPGEVEEVRRKYGNSQPGRVAASHQDLAERLELSEATVSAQAETISSLSERLEVKAGRVSTSQHG